MLESKKLTLTSILPSTVYLYLSKWLKNFHFWVNYSFKRDSDIHTSTLTKTTQRNDIVSKTFLQLMNDKNIESQSESTRL